METLIIIIVTWWIVYVFLYSPKARIKFLWKKIMKFSFKIAEVRKKYPTVSHITESAYKKEIIKMGNIINALLDYYFDSEEDGEYIKENRYSEK